MCHIWSAQIFWRCKNYEKLERAAVCRYSGGFTADTFVWDDVVIKSHWLLSSLRSAGLAGDGEDNEGVLVCQRRCPTHRSQNQENPVPAQPTWGDQDVEKTTKHSIHSITALLFLPCYWSPSVWGELKTFVLLIFFIYPISFIDDLMIPQSEEPLVGSEERRLKEIRRHQKGLVHYIHPMKSLRRSLKATGVHLNSPTQPIGAQTSSGKLKARHAAKNHLGDLRSHLGSHPLSVYLHFILPFRLLLVIRAARSVKYPHFLNKK